jgi:hypothetical protein
MREFSFNLAQLSLNVRVGSHRGQLDIQIVCFAPTSFVDPAYQMLNHT